MRARRAQARLCGRQESPAPVIPAKAGIQRAGTSQPREIKYESRTTNPFSLL